MNLQEVKPGNVLRLDTGVTITVVKVEETVPAKEGFRREPGFVVFGGISGDTIFREFLIFDDGEVRDGASKSLGFCRECGET
jgi:hypothetical protein